MIERYGVEAVMGRRVLAGGEIRRMTYAEAVVRLFYARAASQNWATWAEQNPTGAEILAEAYNAWQTNQ